MKHVFIIGSKGIPAKYGGFETFVEKLTYYQAEKSIKYHIACLSDDNRQFEYNGTRCFNVNVPNIGTAKALYYDLAALKRCILYVKQNNIENFIIYILACRIGPFIRHYVKQIKRLGGFIYVNPDGHEWLRTKWSPAVRKYWKYSESLMIKHAHLLICDSKTIEKYIQEEYSGYNPKTTFIAYGAETRKSTLALDDKKLLKWFTENEISIERGFYIAVSRFVPENNFETIIREFMISNTKKDFVVITGSNPVLYNAINGRLHFDQDPRIKFVGTVYDQELLMKIREEAYGYVHGHSVGGTNPSLLEALGSTDLNLILRVGFNKEVAEEGALYWSKEEGNLARLIDEADKMSVNEINALSEKAKKRIKDWYSWNYIVGKYEKVFLGMK